MIDYDALARTSYKAEMDADDKDRPTYESLPAPERNARIAGAAAVVQHLRKGGHLREGPVATTTGGTRRPPPPEDPGQP